MKIALVSPYDFAFPGGVTSHISSLEIYLTRMGHEVKVIAPASREIKLFGDRFIPIGKPRAIPSSGSVIRISTSFHLAPTIKEVLEREKFDIVHLHEPFMPMLCSAVLRFSNSVNIGTFHAWDGRPGYDWGKPISTWMIKRRRRKLHGHIAVSNMAMRYARKYVPGEYTVIPNGIDIEKYSDDVKPLERFSDGKKNILFFGRLERRKGGIYLMRAFEAVHKAIPDTRLIMAGPGTALRRIYEQWVSDRRFTEDEIVFTGYVAEEDKARYFRTADIYCSPATSRESFGIVLLEGMAAGKPVVASNIDGYNSVVTHGKDGLLFPPKDSNYLADALLQLLRDENLRNTLAANARVTAETYSWEKIARRVSDYYEKIFMEYRKTL